MTSFNFLLPLLRPYLQIQSHLEVPGVRTSTHEFERHSSVHNNPQLWWGMSTGWARIWFCPFRAWWHLGMWLWISLRRSGNGWTLTRGTFTGALCWRTTGTWCRWVRVSSPLLSPSPCLPPKPRSPALLAPRLTLAFSHQARAPASQIWIDQQQCDPLLFLFMYLGLCFSKPDIISSLEQRKELWMAKREVTRCQCPGEHGGVRWGEATASHSSATSDVQGHQQTLPKLWAQKANEILLRMDCPRVHLPHMSSPALLPSL